MVENNYYVLEEDKEVYSDIWDKEKRALINYEVVDLLNKEEERIKKLEEEILDLRVEIGRLNRKKEVEKPHWLKYKFSEGYTKKVNQDIRF